MRAVKFGGSSVADAARLRAAGAVLAALRARGPVTAVVSAMAGVTDDLLSVARAALESSPGWRAELRALGARHRAAYLDLVGAVPPAFEAQWAALEGDVAAGAHIRSALDAPARALAAARLSGWGERLAVMLLATATAVEGATPYPVEDAPIQLLGPERADVVPEPSALATRAWLLPRLAMPVTRGEIPILPGYIARDAEGRLTTLGRNSSDYSAAMIAAALGATRLTIYGDVAGVFTADPRVVAGARLLSTLTYEEAARIAWLGAKALHPRAVEPLAPFAIPLELRASGAPRSAGTNIGPREQLTRQCARGAAWVVAARPASTAAAVEVSALWLPAWPDDAGDDAVAPTAARAMERFTSGASVAITGPNEARVTVTAARAGEVVRALHAALAPLALDGAALEQRRLAAGA